jgi:hypothetical protein
MLWQLAQACEVALWLHEQIVDGSGGTTPGSKGHHVDLVRSSSSSPRMMPHSLVRGAMDSLFLWTMIGLREQDFETATYRMLHVADEVLSKALERRPKIEACGGENGTRRTTSSQQVRQQIQSCLAGMSQELTIVVHHWVRLVSQTRSLPFVTNAIKDKRVFELMVGLLHPEGGHMISAVKDFLLLVLQAGEVNRLTPPTPHVDDVFSSDNDLNSEENNHTNPVDCASPVLKGSFDETKGNEEALAAEPRPTDSGP